MLKTTAGAVAVNHGLPKDLQDFDRVLDKRGLEKLLTEVATRYPDKYREIIQHLARVGHESAYATGGNSFGPEHMRVSLAGKLAQREIKQEVDKIHAEKGLSDDEKEAKVVKLLTDRGDKLTEDVYKESLAEGNPLAHQVLSGARGNATNLRSLRAGDMLYVDHHNKPIPIPILRSYSQGLTPAEYYAGTFGARKGVVDAKMAVQDAGAASKQFNQMNHRLVVSGLDYDGDEEPDAPLRGLPVAVDDPDNEGALLAHDAGPYKRNTVLTPKILAELKAGGQGRLLVRSPLVGGHPNGGLYARDLGVREKGTLPPTGDMVGIAAAQALCLAVGTEVRMADGSAKPIEQIKIGDVVLGWQIGDGVLPVKVVNTYANGLRPCRRYESCSSTSVVCTRDHKFLFGTAEDEYVVRPLEDLGHQYDWAMITYEPERARVVEWLPHATRILSYSEAGSLETYDIEVNHPDHLFVLANGMICSNSEPLTQLQLSSKHSGGVAGASKGATGFKLLSQMVQVPSVFKGGAAHAQHDGKVTSIRPAPQGGTYVTVGSKQHYVAHGFDPTVKVGDEVEAGDVLSEGVPNPQEMVKHKGVGEGKQRFVDAYVKACKDSGITAHRRNVELLARGLIDHVELDDEWEEHVPGDVVSYSAMEHKWKPREGHEVLDVRRAHGQYLERPVLHYSIGTKVKPSVAKTLGEFGIKNVAVHKDPPPFRPVMIRAMENLSHDEDWLTRFLGSYVKKNFLKGVHRGDVSDEAGTSYVPSLARSQGFGLNGGPIKSWQPTGPAPVAPVPAPSIMKQMNEPAPLPGADKHAGTSVSFVDYAALARELLLKKASDDLLGSSSHEYEPEHEEELSDDPDDDYPLKVAHYPVGQRRLPGYKDEAGDELALMRGTDPKGSCGRFEIFRPGMLRKKTKFFARLSPFEKEQVVRAFAEVFAGYEEYANESELLEALEDFKAK